MKAIPINRHGRQIEMTASKETAKKRIKIKDLPKIKLDVYSMLALNNLVVYAVYYLQEHEVAATVEEIVSVCFRLFPQSFALKKYSYWPDSGLVIRRLNDGREKGHLKGNSMDGFSVKYQGKQLAKRVAKALGLAKSAPARIKKKTTSVRRETVPAKPVQTRTTKVISQKKKVVMPAARKKTLEKHLTKAEQGTLPLIKMEEKSRKKSVKLPASIPAKKMSTRKKPQKQNIKKTAQVEQLAMALPILQEQKAKPVILNHVSKEEKAKAGKFVHLMERSDAYIQYKKNGRNSKIGEFDFRSLLLCTMESSHETLAKNVKLFKGYAGIHNRQDLLIFLSHCEDRFSYLLIAPQKQLKKPIRRSTR